MTYNLSDGVHLRFTLLIVGFQPENKGSEWLRAEWLNHEYESEEQCFPASKEAENQLESVGLALWFSSSFLHSFSCDLNVLKHSIRS